MKKPLHPNPVVARFLAATRTAFTPARRQQDWHRRPLTTLQVYAAQETR